MSRNNHNAGMHFQKHSNANYDDLAYYNKNSVEGINNRRYAALSALEEMGVYQFAKYIGHFKVEVEKEYGIPWDFYEIYSYDEEHANEIRIVSTKKKLIASEDKESDGIPVRVHDKHRVVYIIQSIYEEKKGLITKDKTFKII